MRDPINALVEYGSGADVETVIVDGEVVVENGRSTRIDDDELFAQAKAGAKRAWDQLVGARLERPNRRADHSAGFSDAKSLRVRLCYDA